MAHALAQTARNSEAHAALDKILAGEPFDRNAKGFGFTDGSALELVAHGWQVSACIAGCKCVLGKRKGRAR